MAKRRTEVNNGTLAWKQKTKGRKMAAADVDKVLLYTVLECDKKPAHVYLTKSHIIFENSNKPRSHDGSLDGRSSNGPPGQSIPLREVIAVRAEYRVAGKDKIKYDSTARLSSTEYTKGTNTFTLFTVKRISRHRWRHKSSSFACRDYGTCQIWIEKIQELLKSPDFKRPKRLLVFINPFGGKKKAPKIFNDKVRPLFELAGIFSEVIMTKRQYHARDIIYEYDLKTVDGLICVGGDGTFSELLNGLLDRTCSDHGMDQSFRHQPKTPDLRIGIIPAGSTDAIVYSLVGINDPVTSALQIIIGDSIGMDVNALYHKDEFLKYTVTMSGYGYYGDLLKDSEHLRWMGPKRYTWSGVKTFFANKSYEGEVSFLLASEEDGHPRDNFICYCGCEKCHKANERIQEASVKDIPMEPDLIAGGDSNSTNRGNFMLKNGWHRVKGKFSAINLVTITCRCDLSLPGLAPFSHIGDGCMDLILVQDCSRLQYLRHLTRIPDVKSDQFDFDFIQVYRVREFSFQPAHEWEDDDDDEEGEGQPQSGCGGKSKHGHTQLKTRTSQNSVWNCDGEVLDHPNLYVQAHCQLINMFGRGIEEQSKEVLFQCPACCSAYD